MTTARRSAGASLCLQPPASVEVALQQLEVRRDTSGFLSREDPRLWRRALTIPHLLHVLPGESILEIAAGQGAWTAAVAKVLGPENCVTGAIFTSSLLSIAEMQASPCARFVYISGFDELPSHSWDYVIGNGVLNHDHGAAVLAEVLRLLKPGGKCLFFEAKDSKSLNIDERAIRALFASASRQWPAVQKTENGPLERISNLAFEEVAFSHHALLESCRPGRPLSWVGGVLESVPGIRKLSRTFSVSAIAVGPSHERAGHRLTRHRQVFGSTSVVIPCRNEASNLPRLLDQLFGFYDEYILEIIIVNDNSTDETGAVAARLSAADPRVKLINRQPPGGVGRALRDGYAAAKGRFILSMDADFIELLPELRNMFDEVAKGRDGAIGSRFTPGTQLVRYPVAKLICNRALHLLLKVLVDRKIRDVSNNLKLYRADILKSLDLSATGFGANLETGLKPLLDGYDIVEVPVSWINRTGDMGSSSFKLLSVGMGYIRVTLRLLWRHAHMRYRQRLRT